jgi:hypothetical protein
MSEDTNALHRPAVKVTNLEGTEELVAESAIKECISGHLLKRKRQQYACFRSNFL